MTTAEEDTKAVSKKRKLTPAQHVVIACGLRVGVPASSFAKHFGITYNHVYAVHRMVFYQGVQQYRNGELPRITAAGSRREGELN